MKVNTQKDLVSSVYWKEIKKTQNPSKRSHHTTIFAHDSVIIYGGYDGTSYLSDIHQFHITSQEWEELTPNTTSKTLKTSRCGHTSIIVDDKMIVFGGFSGLHHNGF
jgi:hypothetical protein